jgi:hypothetical protein
MAQEIKVVETIEVNVKGSGTMNDPYRPDIPDNEFAWRIVSINENTATIEKIEVRSCEE